MKNALVIFFFINIQLVCCQTIDYSGTYSFGTTPEKRAGVIYIYPDSDSTLLFYLEVGRGAPSYNSGAIVGKMNVTSTRGGHFKKIDTTLRINCEMSFLFYDDSLKIITTETSNECGYGYGVYSDEVYIKSSNSIPEYFVDRVGKKTYFKDLDIDNWSE